MVALYAVWVAAVVIALPRRDAIPANPPGVVVVLSARVLADTTLNQPGATRLERGIQYAMRHNARVVTTRVFRRNGVSSDRPQRRMIEGAGLGDRWTPITSPVTNTRDEALALRAVVADSTPIALVTSPLHSRRACAVFEKVGYRVTCVPAAQYRWWFVPYAVVYETAAFVEYKWRGWW